MKIVKTLALISACITLILVILVGVMGVTLMQNIMGMSEDVIYQSDEYLSIDKLESFGVNIKDGEEVIEFFHSYNNAIARQVFTTGNTSIMLYITILTFTLMFATTTIILIILMKTLRKDMPS